MNNSCFLVSPSVGSNPVCGFEVWDFWRVVRVALLFDFGRRTWVWKDLKFGFWPGFGLFLAEQV